MKTSRLSSVQIFHYLVGLKTIKWQAAGSKPVNLSMYCVETNTNSHTNDSNELFSNNLFIMMIILCAVSKPTTVNNNN